VLTRPRSSSRGPEVSATRSTTTTSSSTATTTMSFSEAVTNLEKKTRFLTRFKVRRWSSSFASFFWSSLFTSICCRIGSIKNGHSLTREQWFTTLLPCTSVLWTNIIFFKLYKLKGSFFSITILEFLSAKFSFLITFSKFLFMYHLWYAY